VAAAKFDHVAVADAGLDVFDESQIDQVTPAGAESMGAPPPN